MAITHSWNGTILTVTSDSGTSSMDLKGEKGDKGCRGPQGCAGVTVSEDGTIITTGLATEAYVDNAVQQIVDNGIDLEDYYTKAEVITIVDNAVNTVDLTNYALKSEIPDVSDFITSIPAEYITETELAAKGYTTKSYVDTAIKNVNSNVDLSNYYTKTETNKAIADSKASQEQYTRQKIAEAQLSGSGVDLQDYATKDYVTDLVGDKPISSQIYSALEPYALKSEIPDPNDFISEIPSEYITETELTAKGYQTETQVNALINAALGVIENGSY